MKNPSIWRVVAGCALGALVAAGMFILLPMSAFFMAVPVALALLWAGFGWIAAAFSACAAMVSAFMLYGAFGLAASALLFVLPAFLACLFAARGMSYPLRMKLALGVQAAVVAALLLATYAVVQKNLADALTDGLLAQIRGLPNGLIDYYLAAMGEAQMPAQIGLLNGFFGPAAREALLASLFAKQSQMLKIGLPACIVNSILYTGAALCHLPARALARRGAEVSYMSVAKWRIGRDGTIVGLLLYATALYFSYFSRSAMALPAYATISVLSSALFTAQGLGAVSRRLTPLGYSRGRRTFMLVALYLLSAISLPVLQIIGVVSAVFGSEGVVTNWRKQRKNNQDKGEM